jgi:hypothetical protein
MWGRRAAPAASCPSDDDDVRTRVLAAEPVICFRRCEPDEFSIPTGQKESR